MSNRVTLTNPPIFSEILYEKLTKIYPGVGELELSEFQYALKNLYPETGWDSIKLDSRSTIESRTNSLDFYAKIRLKPLVNGKIVLDENILHLTTMLLVGLVNGEYAADWIQTHFYFDVRGFFFLVRTTYFTAAILAHFGDKPWQSFEQKQKRFELFQGVGYKDFKNANAAVDSAFIKIINKLITVKGTPILIAIAGPTAAGKTEIVALLHNAFQKAGQKITSIEMDHFLTDRDYREKKGIDSLGKEAIHFDLFVSCLQTIRQGEKITTPRYDFVAATSSHDRNGNLKPGGVPIPIEPADIIFIEGNFPFLLEEVIPLIAIKVVYLTDDHVRMKRKWKRDFDYRRKYDLNYFRNRYFKEQFLMAAACYRPQMQVADLIIDTTGAAIWATPEIAVLIPD